ncbi:MAG TPA: glycine--tRNA ligase subunit alpha [Bacillota bacterium]
MTFQELILRLERFWADQGCLIWQPYDVETGAGTMNPATFFGVLGPDPWRVAYVEPSRRPADGRYGDNPHRLYQHWQYQVILKPVPPDAQELYLESLRALGIDARQHDIRFVEDNWEAPTLAAWGLGWEVWLDGEEVTQYTYFQRMGGIDLDPPAVELTYGLERLASHLQGKTNVFDIQWVDGVTYGDVFRRAEYEHTRYSFDVADVDLLVDSFRRCEREAERVLEEGLVRAAYDYVLKCSHLFNLLEARGAVSVTQRTDYIRRVGRLARRVARAYLQQRSTAAGSEAAGGGPEAAAAASAGEASR